VFELLFLGSEHAVHISEEPATLLEALSEVAETELEEPEVVTSRVDRLANVAY